MAILATIFGMLGRFAGRILTITLGWAGMLLFGQVRKDRQVLLAAITFGSVVWVVLLVGVIVPDIGTLLLAFVPVPDFVDPLWVRIAMLAGAIVLPLVVGIAILLILEPADRPTGKDAIRLVLRGYPLTAALALTLVFLAVIGIVRKARAMAKRWSDAHVPAVVRPGGYDQVVADLETEKAVVELPCPHAGTVKELRVKSGDTIYVPRQALRDAIFATKDFPGLTGVLTCSPTGDCGAPLIAVYEITAREAGGEWPPEAPIWPTE